MLQTKTRDLRTDTFNMPKQRMYATLEFDAERNLVNSFVVVRSERD